MKYNIEKYLYRKINTIKEVIPIITLHESNSEDFLSNNGLGILRDCISAYVIEELNGQFNLEIEYPINGYLASELVEDRIIVADVGYGERQAFRIKSKTDTLLSRKIYANHIFYDLSDNFLEDVYPQNLNGSGYLNWILSHTQYKHKFTGSSDITDTRTGRYEKKNPTTAIIGNEDNSVANLFNGELERDNYNIKLLQHRGTDRGVQIKYAKNLKGITFQLDKSSVVTRIMPTGYNGIELPEKYVDSSIIDIYPHPIVSRIEYTDIKLKENNNDDGFETLEECYEELRKRATREYENGIDTPSISATVDFITLEKTREYEQYKALEKIYLGDTINILIDKLNINVSERLVKTKYDILAKKFISYELGEITASSLEKSVSYVEKLEQTILPNLLQIAKDNATSQITSALGGNVHKAQGELFIMDADNPNTAQKIWRWNLKGLAYSETGINGPYETAMTQDGQIVADFITTGVMSVERIQGLANTLENYKTAIEFAQSQINLMVEQNIDLTKTVEDVDGGVILKNCIAEDLLELHIYGNNTVFDYLYPNDDLYPSDDLFPYGDSRIEVIGFNGTSEESTYYDVYELGITEVLRQNGEACDEYVLKDGKAQVIRRVAKDGTTLTSEKIEDLGEFSIPLKDVENIISIKNYSARIKAKYAIKNSYTNTFATKVEMNAKFELESENINIELNKKTDNNKIIASINMSTEKAEDGSQLKLKADKISLEGNVTANGNFKIDTEGNMSCNNATVTGGKIRLKGNGSDKEDATFVIDTDDVTSSKYTIITNDSIKISNWLDANEYNFSIKSDYGASINSDMQGNINFSTDDSYFFGTIHAYAYNYDSLESLKKNISKCTINALNIVKKSELYEFNYKTENDEDKKHTGFVIGENYNTPDEVIAKSGTGIDAYTMTSILWKAIQEQQEIINNLIKRVEALEGGKANV